MIRTNVELARPGSLRRDTSTSASRSGVGTPSVVSLTGTGGHRLPSAATDLANVDAATPTAVATD